MPFHKSERKFPVKHLLPGGNSFFRILQDHRGAFPVSGYDSTGAEQFRETLIAAVLPPKLYRH
jgi:hypothetical protein